MMFAIGVLLLIGGAFAGSYRDSNTYFDAVINSHLKQEIRYLQIDPADLPSFHTEHKDKIGFITSKVKTDYTGGKLEGLNRVQRWTDCSAPYYSYTNVSIDCQLVVKDLYVEYQGKAKYGKLPTVSIKGKANIPETYLRVEVTTDVKRNSPLLRSLRVERFNQVKIDFTGLGSPLNNVLKGLESSFWENVETYIRGVLTSRFSDALNVSVGRLTMPTP